MGQQPAIGDKLLRYQLPVTSVLMTTSCQRCTWIEAIASAVICQIIPHHEDRDDSVGLRTTGQSPL